MKRLNRRGITLVEMIIAIALLAVITFGVQTMILNMVGGAAQIKQRAKLQKIVRSMMYRISNDTRYVPGAVRDARFDAPDFVPFDDPTVADRACFDQEGGSIAPTSGPACAYDVSYYRLQMVDGKFGPASDLGRLPLYRLYLRVKYTENRVPKQFFISQFMTSVLSQ